MCRRYHIRRAKRWHSCVAPLLPRLPSPFSSGVLDCTSSSSFLMFWCVFLKGLCIWEKKNPIYFNRYLIFIFYINFQRQEVFFVFIRSQILGEPMLKMYIWMSGKKNVSCLTLPFFMCKEKRCKRRSWRDWDEFTTSFTLRKELLHLCQIAWGCAWACTPEFI